MPFPTNFNDKLRLVLEHATGADILAVLSRQQHFATQRQQDATMRVLNGDKAAAPGEVADAQAQVFVLNFLMDDLCNAVDHRLFKEAEQKAKADKVLGKDNTNEATTNE